MLKYIARRLLSLIIVLFIVSFIVYFLMNLTGDPVATISGGELTEEEMEVLREKLGLNAPFIVRYARYIWNVLRGDFGENLMGQSVWTLFIERVPYTIVLAFASLLVALLLSIPFGIIAAVKRNTWIDSIVSVISVAGLSTPSFWLGLLLIIMFSVRLGWLPASGASGIKSIIMPAICSGSLWAALIARTTRAAVLDSIKADFLRTARAKGVSERKVLLKHALGNAWIPIITTIGSMFSSLIGGTVVVETVFSWPGIGNLIIPAVRSNEYVLVTGCVILTTVLVGVVLLIVDIFYAIADPRIKASYTQK